MGGLFATLLFLLAIVLILLVLVQRGRGGGLAGALGGMGGSSAFGAKAGDIFTRITIYVAVIWISVCFAAEYWGSHHRGDALEGGGSGSGSASDLLDVPTQGMPPNGAGAANGNAASEPLDQRGPGDGAGPASGAGAAGGAGSTAATTGDTNSGTPPADDQ